MLQKEHYLGKNYHRKKPILDSTYFDFRLDKETSLADFATFHRKMMKSISDEFSSLITSAEHMLPCLVKIEEILFGTRTMRAELMASYYSFWESQLFDAAVKMILHNLEYFLKMINGARPVFTIKAVLKEMDVSLDPDAPSVIEGLLLLVKAILDGTKSFTRYYRWEIFDSYVNFKPLLDA